MEFNVNVKSTPNKKFEPPRIFTVQTSGMTLSSMAIIELMRAVLAHGVPFRFCARGLSMAPFVQDGDLITVAPLKHLPPGFGAIVAYIHQGRGDLVVHRVVGRCGKFITPQGDGDAASSDGVISSENLLGQVVRIERNGKHAGLGLGPERYLIACLSRLKLLTPMLKRLSAWRKRSQ